MSFPSNITRSPCLHLHWLLIHTRQHLHNSACVCLNSCNNHVTATSAHALSAVVMQHKKKNFILKHLSTKSSQKLSSQEQQTKGSKVTSLGPSRISQHKVGIPFPVSSNKGSSGDLAVLPICDNTCLTRVDCMHLHCTGNHKHKKGKQKVVTLGTNLRKICLGPSVQTQTVQLCSVCSKKQKLDENFFLQSITTRTCASL